jgi:hypothetical protein
MDYLKKVKALVNNILKEWLITKIQATKKVNFLIRRIKLIAKVLHNCNMVIIQNRNENEVHGDQQVLIVWNYTYLDQVVSTLQRITQNLPYS